MNDSHVIYSSAIKKNEFIAEKSLTTYLKVPLGEKSAPKHTIEQKKWFDSVQTALIWSRYLKDSVNKRGDMLVFIHSSRDDKVEEVVNKNNHLNMNFSRYLSFLILISNIFFSYDCFAKSSILDNNISSILDSKPEILNFNIKNKNIEFLHYTEKNIYSTNYGTELCIVKLPKDVGELFPKKVMKRGDINKIYESDTPLNSIVSMTGSYYGVNLKDQPIVLGLVKENGTVTSPKINWSSGGFVAQSNTSLEIIPIKNKFNTGSYISIIQSKPILVHNGKQGINSSNMQDLYSRSAIGVSKNNEKFLFVVYNKNTGSGVSLQQFSDLIINFSQRNKVENITALSMDGGASAHLYIPKIKRHCGEVVTTLVPNISIFK